MKYLNVPLKDISSKLNDFSWLILNTLAEKEYVQYTFIKNNLFNGKQEKANKEIARLEGALLIESSEDTDDGRKKIFTLSEYGKYILKYRKKGVWLYAQDCYF